MRASRFPSRQTAALFALLAVLPLLLLTYLSTRNASSEVRAQARLELRTTAAVTAEVVNRELTALEWLVESYAARPSLATALATGDERVFVGHIRELRTAAPGIEAVVLTTPEGIVVGGVGTVSVLGRDLSARDWFRGVTATGSTYLSTAFLAPSAGGRPIVASASPVRDRHGRTVAYLVAGYEARYLRKLTAELSRIHDAGVRITDSAGVVIAERDLPVTRIVRQAEDPAVRPALLGDTGLIEHEGGQGRQVTAFAPVPGAGWAVTASRSTKTAYAAAGRIRTIVLMLAVPLGLVMLAGSVILTGSVRSRRRAEREAAEQAVIARALVDSSSDAVALMKPDGDALLTNDSWRAVAQRYGMPEPSKISEFLESASTVVTDPVAYRGKLREFLDDPVRGGTLEFQTSDGRSWRVFSAPVQPPDTPPLGRIFSLSDTTHERQAEQVKDELVATVSHELRTPLASIVGFAELLAMRDPEAPVRQRYLETISSEAKRLTGLINDFLDIQTLEGGSARLEIEEFDLIEVVQRQSEFAVVHTEHRLEVELGDEPVIALGKPERIAQVLANLLTNAVKYSPAGGCVTVRVDRREFVARVSVTDEGIGVAEEHQELVFEKFFRVDSSDQREIGGTGLGLAVAREIVVAHRGRIGCESRLGEGSTFWFEIPLALRGRPEAGEQSLDGGEQA